MPYAPAQHVTTDERVVPPNNRQMMSVEGEGGGMWVVLCEERSANVSPVAPKSDDKNLRTIWPCALSSSEIVARLN
ncbi:putative PENTAFUNCTIONAL AROM POLYPEPTIDE [Anopheles sinensis]|uniref:Putative PENTAFUNCTIONAL AROM POLYPEPTIDE n=1 Tax=Anopheles sinensis TaxID=74873 RepID=A0A084VFN6_ANOSI|nr:putative PENTAFUNCTIONAL AROM POLYPEPTIDE [Anopheles sinensis]